MSDSFVVEGGLLSRLVVGHRGGMVVINNYGTAEIPPSWMALTPSEARALASHLLKCADSEEFKNERCGGSRER